MVYFDIGANIGGWALANLNNTDLIISVEASPKTFENLIQNVSNNKKIIPLNFAVSPSKDQSTTFYHCNLENVLSTLNKDWLTSPESRFCGYGNSIIEFQVPVISIDELIKSYGVPELIKIDVEGAEDYVLDSLTQKVPAICLEWAAEWKEQNISCIKKLKNLGFSNFDIQMEDNYTYRPSIFNYCAEELIEIISKKVPKQDWGMIWAK